MVLVYGKYGKILNFFLTADVLEIGSSIKL
jgi:hypothetical protein